MFARKFRLPATVSLTHAQFISSQLFSLKIAKNNETHNRYGFVVTKKISKRAHIRNRTKRRFRSIMEKLHPVLSQGNDLLFILKAAAVGKETGELSQELQKVLNKLIIQY
jgi:ribonuclease P protein component